METVTSQTIEVNIRVVRVDEPPRIITDGPREMSHWETDRTVRTATRIDTDLDSGVLDYGDGTLPPTLVTSNTETAGYQDATYTATDQEDVDETLNVVSGWARRDQEKCRRR